MSNNNRRNGGGRFDRGNQNRQHRPGQQGVYTRRVQEIRSAMTHSDDSITAVNRMVIAKQSECTHHDEKGEPALTPSKTQRVNPKTGGFMMRCDICKRVIDTGAVNEEDFMGMIERIACYIDIAKINSNLASEDDARIVDSFAKIEQDLLVHGRAIYRAATGNKKKKKKNGGNGGGGGGFRDGATMG